METIEDVAGAGWLRFRGLPFSSAAHDIIDFCSNVAELTEWDFFLKYGNDGRPSGEAFVRFDSEDTAEYAKKELDRKNMGHRFIEVFNSSYEDSQGRWSGGGGGGGRSGGYGGGKGKGGGGGKGKGGGYGRDRDDWGGDSYGGGGGYGKGGGGKGKGGGYGKDRDGPYGGGGKDKGKGKSKGRW